MKAKILLTALLAIQALALTGCPQVWTGKTASWLDRLKTELLAVDLRIFSSSFLTERDPFAIQRLNKEISETQAAPTSSMLRKIGRYKVKFECVWPVLEAHVTRVERLNSVVASIASYRILEHFKDDSQNVRNLVAAGEQNQILVAVTEDAGMSNCGEEDQEGIVDAAAVTSADASATPKVAKPTLILDVVPAALGVAAELNKEAVARYQRYLETLQVGVAPDSYVKNLHDTVAALTQTITTSTGQLGALKALYTEAFGKLSRSDLSIRPLLTKEVELLKSFSAHSSRQLDLALPLLQ